MEIEDYPSAYILTLDQDSRKRITGNATSLIGIGPCNLLRNGNQRIEIRDHQ
jgi:hypothetical protein